MVVSGGCDENITTVVWKASKGCWGSWLVASPNTPWGPSLGLYLRLGEVGAHSLWVLAQLTFEIVSVAGHNYCNATKHKDARRNPAGPVQCATCPYIFISPHPDESAVRSLGHNDRGHSHLLQLFSDLYYKRTIGSEQSGLARLTECRLGAGPNLRRCRNKATE